MRKILILFAHPRLEKSRVNKLLLEHIPTQENITLHDLYETYPNFNIQIEREKELLLNHDVIVWHHPFYWYSCPPLLKQWIDMVLEFGWAYGPGGTSLKDKIVFNTITTGGMRETYEETGRNRFSIQEYLRPFEQTAYLCQMKYLPPFTVQGTHRLEDEQVLGFSKQYALLLKKLSEGPLPECFTSYQFLNDLCTQ